MELITMAVICLADWGCAASHMVDEIKFKPYQARKIPVFGDVWHLIAGLRYPALVWFAWLGFGTDWRWYLATALVNALGWGVLKVIHNKSRQWGLLPRWLKQLMGRS